MYTKETLKKIADVLKLDVSVFETNLKSDKEETLEVPVLYTEEAKTDFGKNRFEEGKKAATEIAVKDLKTKYSLDFQGKSLDDALEAYAGIKVAEAKVKPDERVTKLEAEKKELQAKMTGLATEKENLMKEHAEKMFQVGIRSDIFSFIPDNTVIPKADLVDLFMNRHRVAKEDSSTIVYKGDQALKDNVLNAIPVKDVVAQFCEPYINKSGMGGGDKGGGGASGKFKKMSEFVEYCKKNNMEPMATASMEYLNKNKEADFDSNN